MSRLIGSARALMAIASTTAVALSAGCSGKIFYLPASPGSGGDLGPSAEAGSRTLRGVNPPLRLLWEQKVGGHPLGKAVLAGPLLLQLTKSPKLYAFDRYNGNRLGRQSVPAGVCAPPRLAGPSGRLLVLGEGAGKNPALRAMDRQTRQTEWTLPGAVCAPVAARNDTVIVPLEAGGLVALAAGDGSELWRAKTEGGLVAGPTLSGDSAFAGDIKGNLLAVSLGDGSEIWSVELGASLRSPPLVDGGRVFASTGSGVALAFDSRTGEALWQRSLGALLTRGLAVADSVLIVGCSNRMLYGLDVVEGGIVWQFETGGAIRGAPAATAETVYTGSSDGFVYALDVQTGELKWKFRLDGPVSESVFLDQTAMSVTTDAGTVYLFGRG